jgi:hypothetical protein
MGRGLSLLLTAFNEEEQVNLVSRLQKSSLKLQCPLYPLSFRKGFPKDKKPREVWASSIVFRY